MEGVRAAVKEQGLSPPREEKGSFLTLAGDSAPTEICISYVHKGSCVRAARGLHCSLEHPEPHRRPLCKVFHFCGSCSQGELCVGRHELVQWRQGSPPSLAVQSSVSLGLRVCERVLEVLHDQNCNCSRTQCRHDDWPILGCVRRSGSKHSDMLIALRLPSHLPLSSAVAALCNDPHLHAALLRVYMLQSPASVDTSSLGSTITSCCSLLRLQFHTPRIKVRGWPPLIEKKCVEHVKQLEQSWNCKMLESDNCDACIDMTSTLGVLHVGIAQLRSMTSDAPTSESFEIPCVDSALLLRAPKEPSERDCRAVWKLEECRDRLHLLFANAAIVDCGAAPGSWTRFALTQGASTVLAIDPAELYLLSEDDKKSACHIKKKLEDIGTVEEVQRRLGGPADFFLCDANVKDVVRLVEDAVVGGIVGRGSVLLLTVKGFALSTAAADKVAESQARRLEELFCMLNSSAQVLHLLANSPKERTIFLQVDTCNESKYTCTICSGSWHHEKSF